MHSRRILRALNADGLGSPGVVWLPLSETVERWKRLTALALLHLSGPPGWQRIMNAPLTDKSGLGDLRQLLGVYTARDKAGKGNPFASFSSERRASGSTPGSAECLPRRESGDTPQAVKVPESLRLTRQKASRISAKAKMADSGHSLTGDPEKETEKMRPVRPHTRLSAAIQMWRNFNYINLLKNGGFRTMTAPLPGAGATDALHQFFAPRQDKRRLSGDSPVAFSRKENSPAGAEAFRKLDNSRVSDFIGEREVPKDKTQLRNGDKRGTKFRETHGGGDQTQPVGAALVKSYLDALTAAGSSEPEARPHVKRERDSSPYGVGFSGDEKKGHHPAMAANQNRSPDIKPSRFAPSPRGTHDCKRSAGPTSSHRLSVKDSGQYFPPLFRKPEAGPSEDRQFLKSDHVRQSRHTEGLAAQKSSMKTGIQNRTDEQNRPDGAITELIDRTYRSRLKPASKPGKSLSPNLADTVRSALPSGPEAHRERQQQTIRDFRSDSGTKLSGGKRVSGIRPDFSQHSISPFPPHSGPSPQGEERCSHFPKKVGQGGGGIQKEKLLEALVASYWERSKAQAGRIRTANVAEMNEKPYPSTTSIQKRTEHLIVERNTGEPEIIARSGDEEGESPEALSRKINDILIEQARRYGIDL